MRTWAGCVLALALTACGQGVNNQDARTSAPMEGIAGGVAQDVAEEAAPAAEPRAQAQPAQSPAAAPVLYLAYSYGLGLEVPAQRLTGVMEAHVNACQTAGPLLCQLIGSNVAGDPDGYMQGFVSLRGEPAWLQRFMGGIAAQVDAAGGRIQSRTTNSEDLTRAIVDTEARLRAQTSLRDRLQDLLNARPGRLADLLEVERELARVQAEIDSVQSNLAVMRTRVSMSELTLNYQSAPRPVGSDTFEPLRQAFARFLGIVVAGFAAIVMVLAGLIPVAVVAAPIVWLALRWRKRRSRGRLQERTSDTQTPPAP